MSIPSYTNHRADPDAWARRLGISRAAIDLYLASEVIDLHVDSFIWTRVLGYDLRKRHGRGLLGARYFSQADLPRMHEAAIGGAMWSITTQPWRTPQGRLRAFSRNLARLRSIFGSVADQVALVRNEAEYRAARAAGKHGAFLAIQGGNAVDAGSDALECLVDDLVVRITLVHMTNSSLGDTSAPLRLRRDRGLTLRGKAFVEALNARRIFVDLAHIGRRGFFDAVDVHDKSQPLIVTHTGVSGAHGSWRNVDDDQLRAVADTGGVIGVVFHGMYLGGGYFSGGSVDHIVNHLLHIVETVGEDHAALGSDWDGMIVPPHDMRTCLEMPRLVHAMLERGMSERCIRKILGENFLRALAALRPI